MPSLSYISSLVRPDTPVTYVTHRDRPAIIGINSELLRPWKRDDLAAHLESNLTHKIVAYRSNNVVGFAFFKAIRHAIEILQLAVNADYRRSGVGSALLFAVKAQTTERQNSVLAIAPDWEVPSHYLLCKYGFETDGVERDHFGVLGDGYKFVWPCDPLRAPGYHECNGR